MAVLPTGIGPVTGYNIERSLRFNSADSAYLNWTPASAGNRKTWTWSGWVKLALLDVSGSYNSSLFVAGGSNSDGLKFYTNPNSPVWALECVTAAGSAALVTSQVFRDPSAWYHIMLSVDTTNATSGDRMRLYVNGSRVTAFASATYPSLDAVGDVNNTVAHYLGRQGSLTRYFNGYMTDVYFVDGQALTPSSFGETDSATGVWKPKAFSSTYGTNGFFLKFADNSNTTAATLGKDSSGNGNNWTPNNFSVTAGVGNDSLVDSPTSYGTDTGVGGEVRGNYCTLNPLWKSSRITLSNGNLDFVQNTGNYHSSAIGTLAVTDKVYFECTVPSVTANGRVTIAITNNNLTQANLDDESYFTVAGNYGVVFNKSGAGVNSTKYFNGSTESDASYTWSNNDVLKIAVDISAGNIWLGYNNTWIGGGNPASGTSPTYSGLSSTSLWQVRVSGTNGTTASQGVMNFGQRAFAYTAPSGFKALCTQNLPTPTIGATNTTQANDYFDVTLYTGTDATQSITNSGSMQPDFVWVKARNGAYNHYLYDVIRGSTNALRSSTTGAESQAGDSTLVLQSTGFQVTGTGLGLNSNGTTIVGWQWKGGGTGVSNTAGTITSTVSANTTSGFSIVTYGGSGASGTVGHGLGVAPSMIIVKNRSAAENWMVYRSDFSAPASDYMQLNTTGAKSTFSNIWGGTATSSVFYLGGNYATINSSGNNYVAYCFAPVAGYSVFGTYIGNGSSTDGPFVYTGFRPRFFLIKDTTSANDWLIYDTARNPYNLAGLELFPNSSAAEATGNRFDILSNGFKSRGSGGAHNTNGNTYIYAAFAESPFKYALAR